MTDQAIVRLSLEKPQSLGDLREFMGTAVVLGMPDAATVSCQFQTITLAAFLNALEDR